jgi:hypothetical protein
VTLLGSIVVVVSLAPGKALGLYSDRVAATWRHGLLETSSRLGAIGCQLCTIGVARSSTRLERGLRVA